MSDDDETTAGEADETVEVEEPGEAGDTELGTEPPDDDDDAGGHRLYAKDVGADFDGEEGTGGYRRESR